MSTVALTAGISLSGSYAKTPTTFARTTSAISKALSAAFTTGTGDSQSDTFYEGTGSVGTSGSNLDLAGSLTDQFGTTLTFAEVTVLYVKNTSTTGNLIVGGAASNAFAAMFGAVTHTLTLPPGAGVFLICSTDPAWAVTASTADQLKLASSAGTVNYEIAILGRSA